LPVEKKEAEMTDYSKMTEADVNAAIAERVYGLEVEIKDCFRCESATSL